jgi:protein-S-isoprenylcysteine O-methyltransferase Ste14
MKWFRVAHPATTARHLAHAALQMVCFWGLFLGVLPAALHAVTVRLGLAPWPYPGLGIAGAALFGIASCLGLWSAWTMAVHGRGTPLPLATARELVIRGPYRRLRNPMALAGIAQGVGVGLWLADPVVVLYALSGAVVWHCVARPPEECDLLARFGVPYAHYRAAVPLWWPRLGPYRPPAR